MLKDLADDHARAFRDEQPSLGGALAARAAGDQDDLVLQAIHLFPPGVGGHSLAAIGAGA